MGINAQIIVCGADITNTLTLIFSNSKIQLHPKATQSVKAYLKATLTHIVCSLLLNSLLDIVQHAFS